MADWQVGFHVVPEAALRSAPRTPLAAAWSSAAIPADLGSRLALVASPASSGTADVQRWGSEEGNRVDVRTVDGRVSSITAAVDVRRLDARFGAALLHFVRGANAVLVRHDGLVVEPTINAYSAALRSSEAWRYSNDPATWLASRAADADDEG